MNCLNCGKRLKASQNKFCSVLCTGTFNSNKRVRVRLKKLNNKKVIKNFEALWKKEVRK